MSCSWQIVAGPPGEGAGGRGRGKPRGTLSDPQSWAASEVPMRALSAQVCFVFVALCPNPSDGLDKMSLTTSEMDFWPPAGSYRVTCRDRQPGSQACVAGPQRHEAETGTPALHQRPVPSSTLFKSLWVKFELF